MRKIIKNIGLSGMEILVVLVVIALVASFAFPTISRSQTRIKVTHTMQLIGQVSMLLEMYHADFRRYPDNLLSLQAIGISLDDIPRDPFNPDPNGLFQYFTNEYPYKGSTYAKGQLWGLTSYGPDGDGEIQESSFQYANGEIAGVTVTEVLETAPTGSHQFTYEAINTEALSSPTGGIKFYQDLDATQQPNYRTGDLIRTGPVDIRSLKAYEDPLAPGVWQPTAWE